MTEEELLDRLPQDLMSRGYRAGSEYAWRGDDAKRVASLAAANGLAILGGEVWLATDPGPTVTGDQWAAKQAVRSVPWSTYCEQTAKEAVAFINDFLDHHIGYVEDPRMVVFNLTFADS